MAVVTRKNFCRLMRTLPLTNITPKAIAASTPSSVPRKLISSVEFSDTAERISTVSAPSRSTIRKMKDEQAEPGVVARQQPDLAFDFALHLAPRLHHENHHGDDEEGGHQHDPAFEHVFVQVSAGNDDGHANAAAESRDQRRIDGLAQILAPDLGQISQGDADDQRGLDPFAERNDECLKHELGSAF